MPRGSETGFTGNPPQLRPDRGRFQGKLEELEFLRYAFLNRSVAALTFARSMALSVLSKTREMRHLAPECDGEAKDHCQARLYFRRAFDVRHLRLLLSYTSDDGVEGADPPGVVEGGTDLTDQRPNAVEIDVDEI